MKSSTIAEKLNLEELMVSLKMLSEEMDQSKQQPFSPHFQHDVSNVSVNEPSRSAREALPPRLVEICRKETHSHWSGGHELPQVSQLKEINRKLFEDNRALLKQCIKLRKIIREEVRKESWAESETFHNMELKNLEYQSELNALKIENIELKLGVNWQSSNRNEKQKNKYVEWLQELKVSNRSISHRIEELMEMERSGKLTKSNTTTVTSRVEEYDRDRAITNIKIVYEDKIKVLENELCAHKQEIMRLTRKGQQSPLKARHYMNSQ